MTSPTTLRLAASAGPLLLLFASACADEGSGDSKGAATAAEVATTRRLALHRTEESPATLDEEAGERRRLLPPAEIEPWSATGKRVFHSLVPATKRERELPGFTETAEGDRAPALVVLQDAGQPRHVAIPGPFDPKLFNTVVLRVAVPDEEELWVSLSTGGVERARSEPVSLTGSPSPQLVALDVAALRAVEGSLDELRIEGAGHSRGLMLLEVTLAKRSLRRFLPDLGDAPELIDLGGKRFDQRRGVGVFSGEVAEAVFSASSDEALRFCFGIPRALALPSSKTKLRVVVESPDGQRIERRLALATVWRREAIELTTLGTGEKHVTFMLEGGGEALEACAVSELRVGREGRATAVLVITSDTHRGDHVGVFSEEPLVRTPALDALAARGVYFSDAYAAANTTNPSHTSMMTGLHVRDTRVVDNRSPLIDDARTLAEAFSEAGYHTIATVSVRHLMGDESGLGQGFDRMSGPIGPTRKARETTTQLVTWLDELEGEPVFAWLHVFDAHSPYEPPPSTDRRYYPKGKDPFDPAQRLDFQGRYLPVYLRGLTDVTFPYAQYRAEVDALDQELTRVLEHPRVTHGITAFTADHGESFGAHGIYWDHAGLYPDTLHVPLILAWPEGPHGTRSSAPVRQMDLGRTLLDLAGHEEVAFGGQDLRTALEPGGGAATRFCIAKDGNSASILKEGWLLVLNLRDHFPTAAVYERKRHVVELYDLNTDPSAALDLAGDQPDRARALRSELIDWLGRASRSGLATTGQVSQEQADRLAELGYAGEGADAEVRAGRWIDPQCDCEACRRFAD